MRSGFWLRLWLVTLIFGLLSCGSTGGGSSSSSASSASGAAPSNPPASSSNGAASPAASGSGCNCTPSEPSSTDYRHDAKHIDLVTSTGQDISVATILGWALGSDPAFNAPRSGVENQVFHIAQAYVQFIWLVPNDCDIHMEISDSPSKTAPRMIVETPIDGSYCPTREAEMAGFSRYGAQVSTGGFETQQGIPIDVVGMAFRDFNHQRGTQYVATPWELHPAVVTVK